MASVVVGVVQVAQLMILARLLEPTDFGIASIATLVVVFLTLFADFGIGSALVHAPEFDESVFSSAHWLITSVGLIMFTLVVVTAPALAAFFNEERLVPQLLWMALAFLLTTIGSGYRSLLERLLRFDIVAAATISSTLAGFTVTVVTAATGSGAMAIAWGFLAMSVTRTVMQVWVGRRQHRIRFILNLNLVRPLIRFGGHLTGQRMINYFSANSDFFLIGRFVDRAALGQYSVAYNLANLPSSQINVILNGLFFPLFARVQEDVSRVRAGYLRLQEVASFINFPLLVAMAALAPSAIPLLLGERWSQTAHLLQILCVVGLTRSIAGTVGPLLLVRGRPDLGFRWSVLLASITIPALLVGLWLGEVEGLALAFAAVQVVALSLNYLYLLRRLIGPCLSEYLRTMLAPAASSLTAGAAMLLIARQSYLSLALAILVGAVIYLALSWMLNRAVLLELKTVLSLKAQTEIP